MAIGLYHVATIARIRSRKVTVRVFPPRLATGKLQRAIGCDYQAALEGTVHQALPTVGDWVKELDSMSTAEQQTLLSRAAKIKNHTFDLLGSGPIELGAAISSPDQDFKSGRRWPGVHHSEIVVSYPDESDIKVPWELSRFQHLPTLAAAYRISGEQYWLDEMGSQLQSWIEQNPVEIGVNWACTMDVAIRATNWLAALAICPQAVVRQAWCEAVFKSLFLHCKFIRNHLEWGEARGNHYLSDIVGLLVVSSLFIGGKEGQHWAKWAVKELVDEMEHQVRSDGCNHEMSLSYHRLVSELFICGSQAADALAPGVVTECFRNRLTLMLQFVADTTRPDGLSPQIGDADSGVLLPLGDYGMLEYRSHQHLFRQARVTPPRPSGSIAYPEGGFYVMRSNKLFAIVRCGDVGIGGLGCHAHNDQLSF